MKYFPLFLLLTSLFSFAQNPNPGYWQQAVHYKMEVNMEVQTFKYNGTQELIYTNNSPDTLQKVYYFLFNNAFQPGSEMDIRLKTIIDPDKRMVKTFKSGNTETYESKISTLTPEEIGFMNIKNFKQEGIAAKTKVSGTILEVTLPFAILPKSTTVFTLDFEAQVPAQVRRSGRNSAEGVALSMTQWYPKIAEYDFEGWHADPYIGREFHGVFGNFDVKITIDKNYTIGSTGYLLNKNDIGHGYQDAGVEVKIPKKQKTLTWHFFAPKVHDFAWGADSEYIHDKIIGENNVELHFFYKNKPELTEKWKAMQPKTADLLKFYNKNIGAYPYKQYSIIQGGDGGMEYAMCTLITGERSLGSLIGVTAHEMAHSWFQHILATNEAKHEWMDEGFTSFISDLAMQAVMPNPNQKDGNPFASAYRSYYFMANSGKEQPQTTHADRYDENRIYGISSYNKGTVFLSQLGYLIGQENLTKTLKRYYHDYKFTHPTPNDFKRTAERVSGAVLDWYLTDWTQTTNTIDYGIQSVVQNENEKTIALKRTGRIPMPLDILVVYEDDSKETFYISNPLMRWEKENPYPTISRFVLEGWGWAFPTYQFNFVRSKKIKSVVIDPSGMMADVKQDDNVFEVN